MKKSDGLKIATLAFLFLGIGFFVPAPLFPLTSAEIEDLYEKLIVMQKQAERDVEQAEQIRTKTLFQIQIAEGVLEKANQMPDDPQMAQVRATQAEIVAQARQNLADAERAIRDAKLRSNWTLRAIENLKVIKGSESRTRLVGTTLPFFVVGNVKIEHGGKTESKPFDLATDVLIEGDTISTGEKSRIGLSSMFARGHVITMGPESDMKLWRDTNQETVWHLHKGVIHVASAKSRRGVKDITNPRIETPEMIIEPSDDADFDVYVDERGETRVEVYQGEVKQTRRKHEPLIQSMMEEAREQHPLPPKWWEQTP